MNEIKITTELCREDRCRLYMIIQLLGTVLKPEAVQGCVEAAAEHPVAEPFEATPLIAPAEPQAPATGNDTAPAEKPAESPTEANTAVYKKSDVQALIVRLVAMGKKDEARAVVKAYAASVSALPEDVLAEVMEKLKKLEA